jgi:hypothetical protein
LTPSLHKINALRRLDPAELIAMAPMATGVVNALAGPDAAREAAIAGAHKARLALGTKYFTTFELCESRLYLEQRGMYP